MQIFLSHSSNQKPLVREIKKGLPPHLTSWIDEEKLLFGDSITASIEATIKTDSDYVLLFIDDHAAQSPWVRRELEWTLEAEKQHGRTILLPIVIDLSALVTLGNPEIQRRKYLHLKDYLESSVRSLAEAVSADLFALVCRDMHRMRQARPKTQIDRIADVDALLHANAGIIQKAVFPHRQQNPIIRDKLFEILNTYSAELLTLDQFDSMLASIQQRNLVPGLSYDGTEAFLVEEHALWKADVERQKKERIGRRAINSIRNGMKVFLDAGSTSEEIVRLLCKKIETRAITRVTVATTSVNIADMISDCCVRMGFDDEFSAVRLFIPGGQIRPNTQAIVPVFNTLPRQIVSLSDCVGGFDLAFVGVNGVDVDGGFTTHENAEGMNKSDILSVAKTRVIIGDSSKLGLVLESKFADFESDIHFIVDDDPQNQHLQAVLKLYAPKVLLA